MVNYKVATVTKGNNSSVQSHEQEYNVGQSRTINKYNNIIRTCTYIYMNVINGNTCMQVGEGA